jgi:hypothetical protein
MRQHPVRVAAKAQRSAELEEVLYRVATGDGSETLRVTAASKLLDRLVGATWVRGGCHSIGAGIPPRQ